MSAMAYTKTTRSTSAVTEFRKRTAEPAAAVN